MDRLASRISCYLHELCRHPDRHPGRTGNREATAFFARVAESAGLEVSVRELDCVDWERGPASLAVGGATFDVRPGPYTNPCDTAGPLAAASTIDELEAGDFRGSVLLLHGELCREQLTPKGYPFFDLPGHARIIAALAAQEPAVIVAATGRNPELAGSLYPFPLINDAAFDIPTAYLTDVEGERLIAHLGEQVSVRMESRRIAAQAQHVVARTPAAAGSAEEASGGRIVVFGHIDSADGAPGALDNATGVAILLGLAELLRGYAGRTRVELVPLNGEDYYGATGERQWVADNEGRWDDIVLGLNADGAGWRGHGTDVSLYGCPERIDSIVREAVAARPGFAIGEQWYQSDQSLFLMHGTPAVAVTSGDFRELCATVTHTERDNLELAEPAIVADVAYLFHDLIRALA